MNTNIEDMLSLIDENPDLDEAIIKSILLSVYDGSNEAGGPKIIPPPKNLPPPPERLIGRNFNISKSSVANIVREVESRGWLCDEGIFRLIDVFKESGNHELVVETSNIAINYSSRLGKNNNGFLIRPLLAKARALEVLGKHAEANVNFNMLTYISLNRLHE